MKNRLIILLIVLFLESGCERATPETTPATSLVPPTKTPILTDTPIPATMTPVPTLSGGGGGVLAYCYAPASGRMQLNIVNLDGTEDRKLIDSQFGINHMDWSPDGQKIVAVVYMDSSFSTWSIHLFNADGSNPVRLTDDAGVADSEPAWSPDGTRILFTRVRFVSERQYTSEIWLMNADGSDQKTVVEDGFAAKWSPDGTRIIFSSGKTGNYELYTSNPDGTDEQRLTHTDSNESYPSWSPDGAQIVFTSSTGEWNSTESEATYEIFVMNTDGTGLRQLTDNNISDGTPRWSPDGTHITFASDLTGSGQYNIFVMDGSGTNILQVTHVPEGTRAINPVWMP